MSRRHQAVKLAVWAVLAPLVVWQVYKGWGLGHVSMVAAILFHAGCVAGFLWLVKRCCRAFRVGEALYRKLRLASFALLLGLLSAECWLRFVDRTYASYQELAGKPSLYVARYKPWFVQSMLNRQREGSFVRTDRPNQDFLREQKEFSYPYFTNSEGLRDVEHPVEKPPGEYRILAVGDSFTQGVGAPFEDTWPQQLRTILEERTGCPSIRVMNAGRSGSDPVYEYRLLRERLLKYRPDLVLVVSNASDVTDLFLRGGRERYRNNGDIMLPVMPWWEPLYGASYLVRHFVHDMLGLDYHFLTREQNAAREVWAAQELVEALLQFEALAEAEHFSVIYVFHPLYESLVQGSVGMQDVVSPVETAAPGRVIDLYGVFKNALDGKEASMDTLYWPLDRHHTPKGYRVFAEGLADKLLAAPPERFPSGSGS